MTAPNDTTREDQPSKTWQRRGLFAAAWAAVIGVVMKQTTEPVEAAAGMQFADTTTTVYNTASGPTVIIDSTGYTSTGSVFVGQSLYGASKAGIHGVTGLRGTAPIPCGVYGETGRSAPTAGVIGDATHSGGGTGVVGSSYDGIGVSGQSMTNNIGVQGISSAGIGVQGTSSSSAAIYGNIPSSSNANTMAIYGVNASSYQGTVPGTGGWGVVGVSRYGHGVLGATSAQGAGAVVGNSYGIGGAWAGIFFGPAIVEGDFTVFGGAKSAAVPHPDGSHRRLYCLESPESWFEDFGDATLACGEATIALDPDFTAVADTAKYHVFLTGYDGQTDLSVCERTPAGFEVRSTAKTGDGTFSWRVVAKRKDITAPRFESVTVPPAREMPAIPEPLAPTLMPTPRRH